MPTLYFVKMNEILYDMLIFLLVTPGWSLADEFVPDSYSAVEKG
jgi:hypothetical protein